MNRKSTLSILFGLLLTTGLFFQNCGQMQSQGQNVDASTDGTYDEEAIFNLEATELAGTQSDSLSTASTSDQDKEGPYTLTFTANTRSGTIPGTIFPKGSGYKLTISNESGVLAELTSPLVKTVFHQPYKQIEMVDNDNIVEFLFKSRNGLRAIKLNYNKNQNAINYKWAVKIGKAIDADDINAARIVDASGSNPKRLAIGDNKIAKFSGTDAYYYHWKKGVSSKTCHDDGGKILKSNGTCDVKVKKLTDTTLNGKFVKYWMPSENSGNGAYSRRYAKSCDEGFERTPSRRFCLADTCGIGAHKVMRNGIEVCATIQHKCASNQGLKKWDKDLQDWATDGSGDCNCNDASKTHYPHLNACLAATRSCEIRMYDERHTGVQYLDPVTGTYGTCEQTPYVPNQTQGEYGGGDNTGGKGAFN